MTGRLPWYPNAVGGLVLLAGGISPVREQWDIPRFGW
jgi:hypothetical protein